MNLNVQRGVGLAVGILALISGITGLVMGAAQRFAALDTRLGKLESAIKAINAQGPDEKYRQLVKELMAEKSSGWTVPPGQNYLRIDSTTHSFMCSQDNKAWSPCAAAGAILPADAGAAADAPAVKVPQ